MSVTMVLQLLAASIIGLIMIGLFSYFQVKSGIFFRNKFHNNTYIVMFMNVLFTFSIYIFSAAIVLQLVGFNDFKSFYATTLLIGVPLTVSSIYCFLKFKAMVKFRLDEKIKFFKSIKIREHLYVGQNILMSNEFLDVLKSKILSDISNDKKAHEGRTVEVIIDGVGYALKMGDSYKMFFDVNALGGYGIMGETTYETPFCVVPAAHELQSIDIFQGNRMFDSHDLLKLLERNDLVGLTANDLNIYDMIRI